jgi:hypothetical protein
MKMPPDIESAGWGVWSMHVLEELKRLNIELKDTNEKFDKNVSAIRQDFEDLRIAFIEFKTATVTEARIKNGFWGAISGATVAVIIYLVQHSIM